MTDLASRWDAVMMPNYGTPPVAIVRGEGCRVWDSAGREYLDLIAGIAVSALGHGHPALVEAASRQVATVAHTSNLVVNEPALRLAERLVDLLGGDARVFFSNDGATANEAAYKLVRKHGPTREKLLAKRAERQKLIDAGKNYDDTIALTKWLVAKETAGK